MKDLPADILAKWTSSNTTGVSFAGFTVPTTETAPWGEEGRVVERTVVANFETGEYRESRRAVHGIWSREQHALDFIIADGEKDAGKRGCFGLAGLVRINIETSRNKLVIVHGRCLAEDEERLHESLHSLARAEIQRIYARALQLKVRAATAVFQPPSEPETLFGRPDPSLVPAPRSPSP